MKPSTIANASFWATIGLIILFSISDYYIGTIALLVCLIFLHNTYAGRVARIYMIVSLVLCVVLVILVLALGINWSDLLEYEFPILNDNGAEAFRNILNIA